jgi:uncharacterized protein (DUF1697 family)
MKTWIAFLRGINVGGKALVSMAELKTLAGKRGFENVRTLLNSGNVLFDAAPKQKPPAIETQLEEEIAQRFKVPVSVMLRSAAELAEVVAENPFPKEAENDPSHLVAMFLKNAPEPAQVEAVRGAIKGREKLAARGRELYITYPDGIGTSKLTNTVIEKYLKQRGTARNWNTLLKALAMIQE